MDKFQVKDMKLVFNWTYNFLTNTDCTICHCNLNTNSIYNQDKCIDSLIVKGVCSHSFHNECIMPWLINNKNCPICNELWKATNY